jgi:hypothetical protein
MGWRDGLGVLVVFLGFEVLVFAVLSLVTALTGAARWCGASSEWAELSGVCGVLLAEVAVIASVEFLRRPGRNPPPGKNGKGES